MESKSGLILTAFVILQKDVVLHYVEQGTF